ncbi:unnamed protein product, partial [Ixodes persulcatus]
GQPDPEVCNLPADTGPCRARMPRWYFNSETRECETFIYGGCRGNANNFLTRQLCLLTCALGIHELISVTSRRGGGASTLGDQIYLFCSNMNARKPSKSELDQTLKTSPPRNCESPADPGPCKGYFLRWFFNVETSECEQFVYGGCKGNLNNYYSKEQCESTCAPRTHNCTCLNRAVATAEVLGRSRHQEADFERDCLPEADSGPCFGYFPSWYFNVESGKCESFTYGGCKGNNNNYYVHADCVKTCENCEFPAHTCVVTRTNTTPGLSVLNPCFLPKKVGPCKAGFPRYYFDPNTGKCEPFTYGGCQGNANNFETVKDCLRSCVGMCSPLFHTQHRYTPAPTCGRTSDDDVCKRPAKTGMCAGYFPRWFFNTKTGKCEEFVYGGCQSNGNNFVTLEQCQYTCPNTTRTGPVFRAVLGGHGNDTCSLPKKVGPCRAHMPRYYFDVTTGKCEQFIYGGCDRNANNFNTLTQCQRMCKDTRSAISGNRARPCATEHGHSHHDCKSPKDPGPCLAYIPRWFFNVDTGECERLIYGGCLGNDNNYWSHEQCQKTCARGTSLRGT